MASSVRPELSGGLLTRAQHALGLSQSGLGDLLAAHRSTIGRWQSSRHVLLLPGQLHDLVRAVHPHDPALAAELAASQRQTLESLGIEAAPPATALVAEPLPREAEREIPAEHLVDTIVCVVADVLGQTPAVVRPAVRAAFERAAAVGLGVHDVVRGLDAAANKV
jgi:hypothetical protein